MTNRQKLQRMHYLLEFAEDFMPEHTTWNIKLNPILNLEKFVDQIKELSLRSLLQVTNIGKAQFER
jgi:hypothetical protein